MSVSGYSDRLFKQRLHQYVVSLSKTPNPHYFSWLNCEMSTKRGHPREGCLFSAMNLPDEIALKNQLNFLKYYFLRKARCIEQTPFTRVSFWYSFIFWYTFVSWVDWSNAYSVFCSRTQRSEATGVEPSIAVPRNRHLTLMTNILQGETTPHSEQEGYLITVNVKIAEKQLVIQKIGSRNVRSLFDRICSACPEWKIAIVAKELLRYDIWIQLLCRTQY